MSSIYTQKNSRGSMLPISPSKRAPIILFLHKNELNDVFLLKKIFTKYAYSPRRIT